jgi:hypothetical protein
MHWLPFTPMKIRGTHFCNRLSRPQGHSVAGRIRSIEKSYITKISCDMFVPVYQITWCHVEEDFILRLIVVRTQNLRKLLDYVLGLKAGPGLIPGMVRFFSPSQCPDQIWGPPSLPCNGCWGQFPLRVKQLGCEADHSTPSSYKVKNGGAISPLPHTSSCHSA